MTENPSNEHDRLLPIHALILVALINISSIFPAFRIWPLLWVVPLAIYAALLVVVRPLRRSFRPFRFGRITVPGIAATAIIAVGSSLVLIGYQITTNPDLHEYRHMLPVSALGGVVTAGVVFSVFNALFEEIVFRGVVFDAVESEWGGKVAIAATAFLFGYGHMHGYPSGPVGAILAGIYGLCLGWLRAFSGGIGLPVIAHIAADTTIYIIIARSGVLLLGNL